MERERLLIDTSILIDHFRKTQKNKTVFYTLTNYYDFCISSITAFEFLVGATPRNRAFVASIIDNLLVLPFDTACVNQAVLIYHNLKSENQIIPLPDIFIAATAITYDLKFATLNQKHFERIHDLKLNDISDVTFGSGTI